jgi:hypothetical protein
MEHWYPFDGVWLRGVHPPREYTSKSRLPPSLGNEGAGLVPLSSSTAGRPVTLHWPAGQRRGDRTTRSMTGGSVSARWPAVAEVW